MREILWVAAIAIVALLFFRSSRVASVSEPPVDEAFTAEVVAPSHTVPVIVKFGAEWCGPCRAMEGELDRVEQQLKGQVRIVKIDIDEHSEWADHFGVSGIPDTMIFEDGKGVARERGLMRANEIIAWVQPWLE